MCIATAAAIAGIAGGAISAGGAIEGGYAKSQAASYQAAVARNNQIIAEQNAIHAEQAGNAQAQAVSLKGAANIGKIKTAQAASGIDVNTGSAATVQQSARTAEKLDAETVMSNTQLQAYGYRSQATSFAAQAGLEGLEGQQAIEGGYLSGIGSLLSSASAVGLKWGNPLGGTKTALGDAGPGSGDSIG